MKLMLRSFLIAGFLLIPALASAQVGLAPLPQCQITVTPTCVQAGSRALLKWQSVNATGGKITTDNTGDVWQITPQSSLYVTPSKTTLYTATMSGQGGQNFCNVRLTVAPFGSNQCSSSAAGSTGAGSGSGTGGSTSGASNPASLNGGGSTNGSTLDNSGSSGGTSLDNGASLQNGSTLDNTPTLGNTPTLNDQGSTSLFPTGQTTTPTPAQTNTSLANGLVPTACAGEGAATDPNCNICAIGQLVQNVINFLLGASILVAAIMFAYAGYLFFTSNGDTGRITKGRDVFRNVGIGFIIALSAWLLVQTILGTLVGGNFFSNVGGSWNTLNCSGLVRLNNVKIQDWLTSSLPSLAPTQNNSVSCSSGSQAGAGICTTSNGGYQLANGYGCTGSDQFSGLTGTCVNSNGSDSTPVPIQSSSGGNTSNAVAAAQSQAEDALISSCANNNQESCNALNDNVGTALTDAQREALLNNCDNNDQASCDALQAQMVLDSSVPGSPSQTGVGDCSPSALSDTWGSSAAAMSCIAQQESSCNASLPSKVDVTSQGYPFSYGLYQINLTANQVICPGQPTLNCPSAFSGKNSSAVLINPSLYNQCVTAAQTASCNTATAENLLYNTPKGIKNWSTAGACGL